MLKALACCLLALLGVARGDTLIWSEEFNYEGRVNESRWKYDVGPNWYNGELQFYTQARLRNARVRGGSLAIIARNETFGPRAYTSARLVSLASWKYGRMNVRARLTRGEGLWPAIWMLPDSDVHGPWPASGEIDIMEHWSWDADAVYGSAHSMRFNVANGNVQTGRKAVLSPSTRFHVYSIDWTPSGIQWLVDGVPFYSITNAGGSDAYPFDSKFHFVLNVAVEGKSPGKEGTWSKRRMDIDYVRVYQNLSA